MLLCIDCGNTNTVFAIWDGAEITATWRIATDHRRTADEYFVWLSGLMALKGMTAQVTEAIISSTVPRVVFNLRVLCNRYYDCRPLVVGKPECALPVAPRVDEGTTVGPDRLVNTVACIQSGVFWGYIGLVEGIVRQIRRERDRPMKVIATGGLAELFDQGFDLFDSVDYDLTIHGLRLINDYNKGLLSA